MDQKELIIHKKLRFASLQFIFAHRYVLDSAWRDDPIPPWNALIYIIKGRISLTIHNNTSMVTENSIISLTQFQHHNLHIPAGETAEVIICCFKADCENEITGQPESVLKYMNIPNMIKIHNPSAAERLFRELVNTDHAKNPSDIFKRIENTARLMRLLAEISSAEIILPQKNGFDFSDTITFIDRYYCQEKITIDMLAQRLNVSPAHFMREFKKKYGISCKQYIKQKRINHTLDMLRGSDAPISEIARMCMFDSPAYMSELIKRTTGMSPTKYRETFKKTQNGGISRTPPA